MEIPLKSKPKVSVVNLMDESKFALSKENKLLLPFASAKNPIERVKRDTFPEDLSKDLKSDGESNSTSYSNNTNINTNVSGSGSGTVNYKLTRTYSETETNNFDLETGHRLYDDGKIRPTISRANSRSPDKFSRHRNFTETGGFLGRNGQQELAPRFYTRSQNVYEEEFGIMGTKGLEDEYIPDLDFSDMVYQWNQSSGSDLELSKRVRKPLSGDGEVKSGSTTSSNTPHSRDVSYLDLNLLHSQVAPQPILRQQSSFSRLSFTKLNDFMKLRNPNSSNITSSNIANSGANNADGGAKATNMQGSETINLDNASTATLPGSTGVDPLSQAIGRDSQDTDHKLKKQKHTAVNSDGAVNYEFILNSLPSNFNDLPYSQRKKIIKSYSESIDYSQFSLIAKQFYTDKFSSSSGGSANRFTPGGSSFSQRRSRRNSANTVAGRLLALSSSSDLPKLASKAEVAPKTNVDEKGAIVLNHELGKVIGFGAWGTIRECKNLNSNVLRACKIVKSIRNECNVLPPTSSNKSAGSKILNVFKKEIEIWRKLNHPNVLPLLDHIETENAIFCITNRIFGGTLFELVSSWGVFNAEIGNTHGPIGFLVDSQRERILKTAKCAKQIVQGLKYLHQEMGIVHGDIKLENVLVDDNKMVLCDFGMSRIYSLRLSRRNSIIGAGNDGVALLDVGFLSEKMLRSKSSNSNIRKPLNGSDSVNSRHLSKDDSKIGISQYARTHGPSLQSLDLTPTQSLIWGDLKLQKEKETENAKKKEGIESNLPHLHIGSLPYASPELLLPSPPPLGPSADIWALGILLYTMIVGKLPFQHPYEPRLRAFISAGKYNKEELKMACLNKCIIDEETAKSGFSSFQDLKRVEEIENLRKCWDGYDNTEFKWMYDLITGCLEKNITKRYDLGMIYEVLMEHDNDIQQDGEDET